MTNKKGYQSVGNFSNAPQYSDEKYIKVFKSIDYATAYKHGIKAKSSNPSRMNGKYEINKPKAGSNV